MDDQLLNNLLYALSENRGTQIVLARGIEHINEEVESVPLSKGVAYLAASLLFKLQLLFSKFAQGEIV